MKKTACLETFGCQMNRLDSELIRSLLEEDGYEMTADPGSADLVLFNTCSVRQHAEARVYGRLGMLKALKEKRPAVVIAVLGCMAQKDREQIFERAPHVDVVCGTAEFPSLLEFVERVRRGDAHQLAVADRADLSQVYARRRLAPNQFHAFVAVMRGCDNFCSYCVVPYVRGREVSRPMAEVVDEVKRLVGRGVLEFTLLGQNISSYGKGLHATQPPSAGNNDVNLAKLLRLVSAIVGVRRLAFITSHPADMTREILAAMRDCPNASPYLHLPAQSGSTPVLQRMNRGYTRERYIDLVREAYATVPGLAVATDFIVGFPGETDADFRQSLSLVEECRFSSSFIFKYSPRPGTKAAGFPDDVPMETKRRRNADLLALQQRISSEENAKFVGRTVEVLIEGPSKTRADRLTGRAPDHRIVIVGEKGAEKGDCPPKSVPGTVPFFRPGDFVPVTIASSTALALYGSVAAKGEKNDSVKTPGPNTE
jgi:tRNA-2-methylthio-N6-dimethylallyladenosine synthase